MWTQIERGWVNLDEVSSIFQGKGEDGSPITLLTFKTGKCVTINGTEDYYRLSKAIAFGCPVTMMDVE